jgi:hypothetical protein
VVDDASSHFTVVPRKCTRTHRVQSNTHTCRWRMQRRRRCRTRVQSCTAATTAAVTTTLSQLVHVHMHVHQAHHRREVDYTYENVLKTRIPRSVCDSVMSVFARRKKNSALDHCAAAAHRHECGRSHAPCVYNTTLCHRVHVSTIGDSSTRRNGTSTHRASNSFHALRSRDIRSAAATSMSHADTTGRRSASSRRVRECR